MCRSSVSVNWEHFGTIDRNQSQNNENHKLELIKKKSDIQIEKKK